MDFASKKVYILEICKPKIHEFVSNIGIIVNNFLMFCRVFERKLKFLQKNPQKSIDKSKI